MSNTNRPLWRMMHAAHFQHADPTAASALRGYAAELRAIADWLVPGEELEPLPLEEQLTWVVRSNLRQRILSEAARAEAGE